MEENRDYPYSIKELLIRLQKRFFKWLFGLKPWVRRLIIYLMIPLFLIGSVIYILKDKIIDNYLKNEDKPEITLSFNYRISHDSVEREGKLNDVCYSGDILTFYFKPYQNCWLTVFGIDSKRIISGFNDTLKPTLVGGNRPYDYKRFLDTVPGIEVYYAIASHENFNFERDIKPHIINLFPKQNTKGTIVLDYEMNLPDRFVQKFIYFRHFNDQNSN